MFFWFFTTFWENDDFEKEGPSSWKYSSLWVNEIDPLRRNPYSGPKGRRNEPPFFQKQPPFCWYLLIGVSYDSNFFFERKDMMLENVLDTQNTVVGRQENFLRRLEVFLHSLKAVFGSPWRPWNLAPNSWRSETQLQTAVKNFVTS